MRGADSFGVKNDAFVCLPFKIDYGFSRRKKTKRFKAVLLYEMLLIFL
jgi:hypothetical protein